MEFLNPFNLVVVGLAVVFVPLTAAIATSFLKIVIVLNILRNAIGANQVPPNYVVNAIAAVLSIFIMAGPASEALSIAETREFDTQSLDSVIGDIQAILTPIHSFMVSNTNDGEAEFFEDLRDRKWSESVKSRFAEDSVFVVVPAFVMSEVKTAFQIGFLLYIPFIIIDVVVASVLVSLSMQSISPMIITLPLKLLLFVSVDGWTNLTERLIGAYV